MKAFLIAGFISLVSLASHAQTVQGQLNDLKRTTTTRVTTITSGTATALQSTSSPLWVIVNPASTLAAHTITLPAYAYTGQTVNITFGGTLTSSTVVTALTIAAPSGTALVLTAAPTAGAAGASIAYRFSATNNKWYRLY